MRMMESIPIQSTAPHEDAGWGWAEGITSSRKEAAGNRTVCCDAIGQALGWKPHSRPSSAVP